MNKILLFLVLFTVALALGACGTVQSTTSKTDSTTEAMPIEKFESLKIADNSLDGYTIVYAESDLVDDAAENPEFYPVWDFNRETAERLSDLIFEVSGIRLPIACDVDTVETKNEILIGKTNRGVTDGSGLSKLAVESYRICVSDAKLAICGGKYGSTWHAIDYLEAFFEKELAAGNANYTLASDFSYKGSFDFIRIGCIGDSITAGSGVSNAAKHAFPAQLERWLWKDAIVYNFGDPGKTMRNDTGKDAYMQTNTYKKVLNYASQIDIFTVMLGTNDAYHAKGWTEYERTTYQNDCEVLFSELSEKNPDVQFLMMNAPRCFGSKESRYDTTPLRAMQKELVSTMNEKGYKTSFFDMYALTKNMEEYFPDKLHPNDMGHTIIAKELAKPLDEMINGNK